MELHPLIRFARGEVPAELLLKNARVVNVLSGEILPADVAIVRSRIVGLGEFEAEEILDLEGAFLAPGSRAVWCRRQSSPERWCREVRQP